MAISTFLHIPKHTCLKTHLHASTHTHKLAQSVNNLMYQNGCACTHTHTHTHTQNFLLNHTHLACATFQAQCRLTMGSFWLGDIMFGYFSACIDLLLCVISQWLPRQNMTLWWVNNVLSVCWLLNVPATCKCITGTDFTCCHTEIKVADQTFHLIQSQYTDTGQTSPSTVPITLGAWQSSHWNASFYDSTLKKTWRKRDALEADTLTTRSTRQWENNEMVLIKIFFRLDHLFYCEQNIYVLSYRKKRNI